MNFENFSQRYQYNKNTDLLGKGGFGSVFKAYDRVLSKWVAIKIAEVLLGNEKFRLALEVQKAQNLPIHENIAFYESCYTFSFPNADYDYAVMQYYDKGNLQQLLQSTGLSVDEKITMLKSILNGIELLHDQNIIHRDLKPENILIVQAPDGEYIPKIADFGISKIVDGENTVATNTVMGGTYSYSSPEQLAGREIRKNADLWSYGILICKIFTGKTPFDNKTGQNQSDIDRAAVINNILNASLHSDFLNIPSPFNRIVELCLEKDSAKRVKDASALKNYLNDKNIPVTPIYQTVKETVVEPLNVFSNTSKNINALSESYPKIQKGGIMLLFGYVDDFNRLLIPHVYNYAEEFSDGLALVGKEHSNFLSSKYQYGFIDKDGRELIPLKYDDAKSFSEGLAPVKVKQKWGFIDKGNIFKIELLYDDADSFSNHLACVMLNNKYGAIDKEKKIIIPFVYEQLFTFKKNLAIVCNNYKYGVINAQNKVLIPLIYSKLSLQDDNLFKVCMGNKYGYIDTDNNGVIPLVYQFLGRYKKNEVVIRAYNGTRWGYIDIRNKVVIDFIYYTATDFENGEAKVTKTENIFFPDKEILLKRNDYLR